MKYLLFFFSLTFVIVAQGQTKFPLENIVITSNKKKTQVRTNENGGLHVNVSPKDAHKFIANASVRYSDFGARGDGKTDDIDAIAAAHAFANQHDLLVKADEGATYYIGGKERTAVIRTDTDFGTAAFIIDDTEVQKHNASIFLVSSSLQPFKLEGISSLKRNQEKIDVSLPGTCLITVTNSQVKNYIRFGPDQNNGSPQTDIFVVDKNGNVDMDAPIIWDFDQITDNNRQQGRIEELLQSRHRHQAFQRSCGWAGTSHHRRRRPWRALWRLHQCRRLLLRDGP